LSRFVIGLWIVQHCVGVRIFLSVASAHIFQNPIRDLPIGD
jgi:hypothetical protein